MQAKTSGIEGGVCPPKLDLSGGPVAQRQSRGLLIPWFRVRIPAGSPLGYRHAVCSDGGHAHAARHEGTHLPRLGKPAERGSEPLAPNEASREGDLRAQGRRALERRGG